METKLWHDLPAVLINDEWVVISADFTNIARIPNNDIDSEAIYEELNNINFFKREVIVKNIFQLILITTSDCNLKCRYCFANSGESTFVMTDEIAEAAINYGIEKSVGKTLSIAFFGGEPSLTDKLIRHVVEYAKRNIGPEHKGVEFSITTNGVISKNFLKFIIDNDFKVTLSADGPDYIQNYQRPIKNGEKSSSFVENTIRELSKADARLKLRVTVTESSVKEMPKIVEWFQKLGGREIHFEPMTVSGRALKSNDPALQKPSVESFAEGLKESIFKGCELGVAIVNSSFMNIYSPPPQYCESDSEKRISVSYTGDATTCVEVQDRCHPASNSFIVGKIDESLKTIVIEQKLKTTICSTHLGQDCLDCFALKVCGGGCPVRNFHATGDSKNIDDYRCQLIKTMLPFVISMCDQES